MSSSNKDNVENIKSKEVIQQDLKQIKNVEEAEE